MAHIYKYSIWEDISGRWLGNDVEDLAGISSRWWVPARILQLSFIDFILLLKDKFHATNFSYDKKYNVLIYYWRNEEDARAFKNYINKKARERKFMC